MERIVLLLLFLLKAMKCNAQKNKQPPWGKELIANAKALNESKLFLR